MELCGEIRWSSIINEHLTFTRQSLELMTQTSAKQKTTWYVFHLSVAISGTVSIFASIKIKVSLTYIVDDHC